MMLDGMSHFICFDALTANDWTEVKRVSCVSAIYNVLYWKVGEFYEMLYNTGR